MEHFSVRWMILNCIQKSRIQADHRDIYQILYVLSVEYTVIVTVSVIQYLNGNGLNKRMLRIHILC